MKKIILIILLLAVKISAQEFLTTRDTLDVSGSAKLITKYYLESNYVQLGDSNTVYTTPTFLLNNYLKLSTGGTLGGGLVGTTATFNSGTFGKNGVVSGGVTLIASDGDDGLLNIGTSDQFTISGFTGGTFINGDLLHIGADLGNGINARVGNFATFGSTYSGGATVFGMNVLANTSGSTGMNIANTNAVLGGMAILMYYASGIEFHHQDGSVTAGTAFSSKIASFNLDDEFILGTTDNGDYKGQINGSAYISGSITSGAPSGGTAAPWKFGAASVTSPTSPNRTIELEVNGTTYYIAAKTTND